MARRLLLVVCAAILCAAPFPSHSSAARAASSDISSAADPASSYHAISARLIGEALTSNDAYNDLQWLCDRIGNRVSGSASLDSAIAWAQGVMKRNGLVNVHTEPVMVPKWVRGEESAWIVAPTRHQLSMLGLGLSVGTPPGGIEAPVVVVPTFAVLDSLGTAGIQGKIVLFDAPYTSYGKTGEYRNKGTSRAAKYGAVGVLVRSITPISYDTPHTGQVEYQDSLPKIPAAAVTIENATLMHRMSDRGETVRVHLEMGAQNLGPVPSANVVGEIPGTGKENEIVVLGAHLDSWDVGQGAQDDGVGCINVLEATHLIRRLGLKPRRTIRVVLFTNEENGVGGGKAYAAAHAAELPRHAAVLETDSGNGRVSGFDVDLKPYGVVNGDSVRTFAEALKLRKEALTVLAPVSPLLTPLGAGKLGTGGSGADVGKMVDKGVAGIGMRHDTTHYFDIHHTRADTFDKIDRDDLARNVAILSVMTWFLADIPGRMISAPVETSAGSH